MQMTNCYVFTAEPKGPAYTDLVEFCCAVASQMIVVVRDPDEDPGIRIREKLARLNDFRLGTARVREWPGTILLSDEALVYSHRVAPGLSAVLRELASHLFQWVHPDAPEDLGFSREDGRVLLTTISHEKDAYVVLEEEEFQVLRTARPCLADILRLEGSAS